MLCGVLVIGLFLTYTLSDWTLGPVNQRSKTAKLLSQPASNLAIVFFYRVCVKLQATVVAMALEKHYVSRFTWQHYAGEPN